jgi:hypothetical protein
MSVVGGARRASPAPPANTDFGRVGGCRVGEASPANCGTSEFVVPTGISRRATLSLPDNQRFVNHADKNISAVNDHTQPKRHVHCSQKTPSLTTEARLLARAGRRTTFISKPPRPVPLGTREAASYQVRSA